MKMGEWRGTGRWQKHTDWTKVRRVQFRNLKNYSIQRKHVAFGNESAELLSVCAFQPSGECANGVHWLAKIVAATVTFVSSKVLIFTHTQEQRMSWITKKPLKIHPSWCSLYHPAGFIPQHNWWSQSCRHSTKREGSLWRQHRGTFIPEGCSNIFLPIFFHPIIPLPSTNTNAITEDVLVFISKCNYNRCKPTFFFLLLGL